MGRAKFRKDEIKLFKKKAPPFAEKEGAELLQAQGTTSSLPPKTRCLLCASLCIKRDNTLRLVNLSRVNFEKVEVQCFVDKLNFNFDQ